MTAKTALDPSAMLQRFFSSCFQKRPERLPSKSPHIEGATETDGSYVTLQPLQTSSHQPLQSPQDRTKRLPGEEEGENAGTGTQAAQWTSSIAEEDPTMPRAAKQKSAAKPASKKPYQRAEPPSGSDHKYFSSKGRPGNDSGKKYKSKASEDDKSAEELEKALNEMFDGLLSEDDVATDPSRNTLGVESAVGYISSVANPEDYSMFVVLDIVQAETMGQISRTGFVKGWSQQKVAANPKSHKAHVQRLCKQVVTDPAYFKKLYDLAFRIGKEPQQRALDMESAITFWGVLFEPTMHSWRSPKVNWLEAWSGFLRGKFYVENGNSSRWTRTVSRDLWTQTAAFAARTMEDESLGFWSEEQAWPGLIDEFVVWCREKGIVPGKKEEGMEVDD